MAGLTVGLALSPFTGTSLLHAQSALLRVQPVASSSGVKDHRRQDYEGEQADRSYNRSETLKVTVTNMQTNPCDYQVDWRFLARDVTTKDIYVYNHDAKTVSLKPGEFTSFDVQSAPLTENQSTRFEYDADDNLVLSEPRREAGAKPYGYVFLVKADGKLVTVEASDRDLKEEYQKKLAAHPDKPAPNARR